MIPIALTIAGSDCSAGAGIQADLKTFQHFRVYGLTAVTCVVSENPWIVRRVHPIPVEILVDQIELMLSTFPVHAIKTGMLFSAEHIRAVARVLGSRRQIPLVVDPVLLASSGDALSKPDAVAAYKESLLPLATLITPNLPEAAALLGWDSINENNFTEAAKQVALAFSTSVLLKGGHLSTDDCPDLLCENDKIFQLDSKRIATPASHGTGCTLSAAIAAQLARGEKLLDACCHAKNYVKNSLQQSLHWP
ncbi:MAG: bifunctional hydroxymethylpyrimidine kinase/phosphomethylpyrimidine kinase, partial [Verrucomicrobia bacterium]|nr:bifunctional hydroxymethylpyrimidine kinase/phosphomethylpyrimidine kinase [Verrucomicrobiota bacterium]